MNVDLCAKELQANTKEKILIKSKIDSYIELA